MSNAVPTCLVIGTGHAAAQLAVSLRQEGWSGRIVLISEEAHLPYHRPPLSKTYLLGEKGLNDLLIRPAAVYAKQNLELRLGEPVEAVDRSARVLQLRSGERLAYDKLALCTGASARKTTAPGAGLAGIHTLRTIDDVSRIKAEAASARRVVVVGGGYIGLELAAALRKLGSDVTVLEMAPRVLARVTAPAVSAFYERVHREEGVRIFTGTAVARFEGEGRVTAVECADGSRHEADLVVVGIGVVPRTELAVAAGLRVDDGIVVDQHACTSDPDIVAAGDCTRHPSAHYGASVRLESVPNATEQARTAAATLCGKERPHAALPWFWSDQFDLKLQIAGLNAGYDAVVLRGDAATGRSFSACYLKAGVLIAADCVSRPKDFMAAKRLIEARCPVDPARLADDAQPLAALLDT